MNTRNCAAVALTTAVILLAGCASSRGTGSAAAFPTGSYQHEQTIVIFKPDGTYVATTPKGKDWVKGKYTHSGNALTVTDTWEGDEMTEDCVGKPGKYTWAKTGKVLSLTVLDDVCNGRKRSTEGAAWTQIK